MCYLHHVSDGRARKQMRKPFGCNYKAGNREKEEKLRNRWVMPLAQNPKIFQPAFSAFSAITIYVDTQ